MTTQQQAPTAPERTTYRRSGRRAVADAHNPASFDHLVHHYEGLAGLLGLPFADVLAPRPTVTRTGRAVDLGCGTGRHANLLANRFHDVLAVDISEPMLAFAREHRSAPTIRYERRHLETVTPDRDGQFDLVLSAYVLHHVPNPALVLDGIRELVAPGGTALVVDLCDQPHTADWFRHEARRALAVDLRRRRRPIRQAVDLYRLATHDDWLAHQASDRPLTPAAFEGIYRAALPGAQIRPLYRARAVSWRRPAWPAADGWAAP
jgi:2-polyprenyl-3-methyl-5-hydroxy-6-metoxy-1,4-benzoquinol methylase